MNHSLRSNKLFTLLALISLSACSSDSTTGGTPTTGSLVVGKLGTATMGSGRISPRSLTASPLLIPSSTAFGYALVDGWKLKVRGIAFKDSSNQEVSALSWEDGKDLEIGGNATNGIGLDESLTVASGDYISVRIDFDNAYSLKAQCRTANKLLYTTAAGIVTVDCGGGACDGATLTDYDYYQYDFAYTTTANGASDTADQSMESTDSLFTISEDSTPRVAILIDNSFVVTCYDGSEADLNSATGVVAPFNWDPRIGTLNDYFPNGSANFGVSYIPMFVSVATDTTQPFPEAETYVASGTQADVDATSLDYSKLLVTTFAFNSDNSILNARSRNFDGDNGTNLEQLYSGFSEPSADVYSFFNGEFYWDSELNQGRYVQDREVENFQRTDEGADSFATSVVDGPECGLTLMGEFGNVARPCTDSTATVYWKRLTR